MAPVQDEMKKLRAALSGKRGGDQKAVAEAALKWVGTILSKHKDYGSAVWKTPILAPECSPSAAIRVRISDKIERLITLLGSDNPAEVAESIDETFTDLGAYCLLLLCNPHDDDDGLD